MQFHISCEFMRKTIIDIALKQAEIFLNPQHNHLNVCEIKQNAIIKPGKRVYIFT
jgi:hypothetical protein